MKQNLAPNLFINQQPTLLTGYSQVYIQQYFNTSILSIKVLLYLLLTV